MPSHKDIVLNQYNSGSGYYQEVVIPSSGGAVLGFDSSGNLVAKPDVSGITGDYVTRAESGQFVSTGATGNFITSSQTGAFAPAAGTGNFVTTSQTGQFVSTGSTGDFITTGQTGSFYSSGNPVNMISSGITPPLAPTGSGTAGQITWDTEGNVYLCIGTNQWVRGTFAVWSYSGSGSGSGVSGLVFHLDSTDWTGAGNWVDRVSGYSYIPNGSISKSGNYVDFGGGYFTGQSLSIAAGDSITSIIWVRADNISAGYPRIVDNGADLGQGWNHVFAFPANVNIVSDLIFTGADPTDKSVRREDWAGSSNTWYHFATVFDLVNATSKLYVNGIDLNASYTTPLTGLNVGGASKAVLGASSNGYGNNFDGKLGSWKVWNRVLTSGEIYSEYTGTSGNFI